MPIQPLNRTFFFFSLELQNAYLLPNTEMDIDTIKSSKKKQARVQKRNQKPRNSIVFQKRLSTAKKGPKRKWGACRVGGNAWIIWRDGGEEEKKAFGSLQFTPAIHVHMFHSLHLIYHTFKGLRYYLDFDQWGGGMTLMWPGGSRYRLL